MEYEFENLNVTHPFYKQVNIMPSKQYKQALQPSMLSN